MDSADSGDYEVIREVPETASSTIGIDISIITIFILHASSHIISDLKADVHRKNSSESSDDITVQLNLDAVDVVPCKTKVPEKERRSRSDLKQKHQRLKSNNLVIEKDDSQLCKSHFYHPYGDAHEEGLLDEHRPSLQSVELDQSISNLAQGPRRHSNFGNSSLCFISNSGQTEIKPTGEIA